MKIQFVPVHEAGGSELLPRVPHTLRVFLIVREGRTGAVSEPSSSARAPSLAPRTAVRRSRGLPRESPA